MNRIRYGVIGLNGIGSLHTRLAHEMSDLDLRVLVDTDRALADRESNKYSATALSDYRQLLGADLVDAVSVCVPHHLLPGIASELLEAGIHVFVEKPFAIRVSDADHLVEVAHRANRRVCVGFQHRTYRVSRRMKEIIDSGHIGAVRRVLWTWHEFRPNSFYERDAWRTGWKTSGGGLLMHQVSHQLDLMLWLFGRASSVTSVLANQMHCGTMDDFCSATIEFESGCVATVHMSLNEPNSVSMRHVTGDSGVLLMPRVNSTVLDRPEEVRVGTFNLPLPQVVVKEEDSHAQPDVSWEIVRTPETSPHLLKVMRPRRLWRRLGLVHTNPPFKKGHETLMMSFVNAIRSGTASLVTENDARDTVELINALIVSSVLRETVRLPIDRGVAAAVLEDLECGRVSL